MMMSIQDQDQHPHSNIIFGIARQQWRLLWPRRNFSFWYWHQNRRNNFYNSQCHKLHLQRSYKAAPPSQYHHLICLHPQWPTWALAAIIEAPMKRVRRFCLRFMKHKVWTIPWTKKARLLDEIWIKLSLPSSRPKMMMTAKRWLRRILRGHFFIRIANKTKTPTLAQNAWMLFARDLFLTSLWWDLLSCMPLHQ